MEYARAHYRFYPWQPRRRPGFCSIDKRPTAERRRRCGAGARHRGVQRLAATISKSVPGRYYATPIPRLHETARPAILKTRWTTVRSPPQAHRGAKRTWSGRRVAVPVRIEPTTSSFTTGPLCARRGRRLSSDHPCAVACRRAELFRAGLCRTARRRRAFVERRIELGLDSVDHPADNGAVRGDGSTILRSVAALASALVKGSPAWTSKVTSRCSRAFSRTPSAGRSRADPPAAPRQKRRQGYRNGDLRGAAAGIADPQTFAIQPGSEALQASPARHEDHVALSDIVVIRYEAPIFDHLACSDVFDVARSPAPKRSSACSRDPRRLPPASTRTARPSFLLRCWAGVCRRGVAAS